MSATKLTHYQDYLPTKNDLYQYKNVPLIYLVAK